MHNSLRAGGPAATVLARGPTGRVASVHRRAINLLIDDGALIGLLPADHPIHPWAVSGISWDADLITEGASFEVREWVLAIGRLRLDLRDIEVVDLHLTRRPAGLPTSAFDAIAAIDARSSADDPLVPLDRDELRACLTGSVPTRLADLVGKGLGHTPSGDDALLGILAALDFCRECWPPAPRLREQLLTSLHDLDLPRHTTRLSGQLLRASAEGQYPEPLRDLLDAAAGASRSTSRADGLGRDPVSRGAVQEAAAKLQSLGRTSGPATLRGLAAVMAAACGETEAECPRVT